MLGCTMISTHYKDGYQCVEAHARWTCMPYPYRKEVIQHVEDVLYALNN